MSTQAECRAKDTGCRIHGRGDMIQGASVRGTEG
jgi:hypothetical protein